jgi:hypothetical protein
MYNESRRGEDGIPLSPQKAIDRNILLRGFSSFFFSFFVSEKGVILYILRMGSGEETEGRTT